MACREVHYNVTGIRACSLLAGPTTIREAPFFALLNPSADLQYQLCRNNTKKSKQLAGCFVQLSGVS